MTGTGEPSPTERQGADVGKALGVMIDALIVSPLETGISVVRDPAAAIGRARQELRNARAIGTMVTNGGMAAFTATTGLRPPTPPTKPPTKPRTKPPTKPSTRPAAPDESSSGTRTPETSAPPSRRSAATRRSTPPSSSAPTSAAADNGASDPLDADELAVPDYDQLPAIDIIDQLGALSESERDAIEAYELAHRRRRTVLGKLDQLRST